MLTTTSTQLSKKKFPDNQVGDFYITDIDKSEQTAVAHLQGDIKVLLDISNILGELSKRNLSTLEVVYVRTNT